jgi:hypothetical protein
MTTPGIRDVYRHIAGLILPKFAPFAGSPHPTSVDDFEVGAVKSIVHRVIAECSKAVPMTGDVKVFLRLASDKFGADYSPPNGNDADTIQGLMDAVATTFAISPSDSQTIYLGIYDHFKGGVYKANKVSRFANDEMYVDYTSLTYGTDHGRFLWEWAEVVKWKDGKYRSRFVFRGPDLRTPEPAFKVPR